MPVNWFDSFWCFVMFLPPVGHKVSHNLQHGLGQWHTPHFVQSPHEEGEMAQWLGCQNL